MGSMSKMSDNLDTRHIEVPIMAAAVRAQGYVSVADKLDQLYEDYKKLSKFRNEVLAAHGYVAKNLDDV